MPTTETATPPAIKLNLTHAEMWAFRRIRDGEETFAQLAKKLAADRKAMEAELNQRAEYVHAVGRRVSQERSSLYQALAETHQTAIPEGAELIGSELVWMPSA